MSSIPVAAMPSPVYRITLAGLVTQKDCQKNIATRHFAQWNKDPVLQFIPAGCLALVWLKYYPVDRYNVTIGAFYSTDITGCSSSHIDDTLHSVPPNNTSYWWYLVFSRSSFLLMFAAARFDSSFFNSSASTSGAEAYYTLSVTSDKKTFEHRHCVPFSKHIYLW